MVNRHKSSLSGHVNLFFLAIIVANYTYTNGPLSMHLNVHSMFIHFQCRLAQPPTHLARFLVSIAGNRRFLRFTSAPNGAESGSPRRREKAPFVGVADLFWGCWDDMTLCFLVKDQLPLAQ